MPPITLGSVYNEFGYNEANFTYVKENVQLQ